MGVSIYMCYAIYRMGVISVQGYGSYWLLGL
jgi:hypothetical protein